MTSQGTWTGRVRLAGGSLGARARAAALRAGDRHFLALVTAPLLISLAAAALVPFLIMLRYSFTDISFTLPGHDGGFVGLENYRRALASDPRLLSSLGVTASFIAATLPVEFALGLAAALVLHRSPKAQKFLVPAIALPALLAPVTVGLVWRLMLHGDYGPVAYLLQSAGLYEGSILGDPRLAFWSVVVVDVWQWTPFVAVVLLTGLQTIPRYLYESAMIDGASDWQVFRDITMPLLRPTVVVVLLFRFVDAFKEFDKIFVLTRGGPASSTEAISVYAWLVSFDHGELGYGSAITLILFVVVAISCSAVLFTARREWR
jgi:multiple sugar transport system permease protein